MCTTAALRERASQLTELMMALSEMAKSVKRGESLPTLTPEQVEGLVLTVGKTLMSNHRELRSAKEKCAAAY